MRKLLNMIAASVMLLTSTTLLADDAVIDSPIAIVVHKDLAVDNLSLEELRSIFLADRQFWENRIRITLLVRAPQSDERTFVLERIYQMSEAQFRTYWIAKMFRAEVPRGPKIVRRIRAEIGLPEANSCFDILRNKRKGCPPFFPVRLPWAPCS